MNTYNDESLSTVPEKNNESKGQDVPVDHPGLQKIVQNENPRANENINGPDVTEGEDGVAGSEITDGEDG